MSFGGPNMDTQSNPEFSAGQLSEDNEYTIRVMGDRVWSYGCPAGEDPTELVYKFQFNDDEEPTRAGIYPIGNMEGLKEDWSDVGTAAGPLVMMMLPTSQHWMDLMDDDEYPDSVVWHRKSGGCFIPSYQ